MKRPKTTGLDKVFPKKKFSAYEQIPVDTP